jgi:hypothetical protein
MQVKQALVAFYLRRAYVVDQVHGSLELLLFFFFLRRFFSQKVLGQFRSFLVYIGFRHRENDWRCQFCSSCSPSWCIMSNFAILVLSALLSTW